MFPDSDEAPSFWARALAVAAVLVNRHPQWALNDWVRGLAGHPAYRGPWLLIEHTLLSGSVIFLLSLIAWHLAAMRDALPPPRTLLGLPPLRKWLAWGTLTGLLPLALTVASMAVLPHFGRMRGLSLGYSPPDPWSILGNFISNFYEEFVFRGFLVAVLRLAFGSQAAAFILASIVFGLTHEQYPIELQVLIAVSGVLWCVAVTRTRSLWTSWLAHEVVDVLGDSLIKAG